MLYERTAIDDSDLSQKKLNKGTQIDAAVSAGLTYSAGRAGVEKSTKNRLQGHPFGRKLGFVHGFDQSGAR